MDYLSLILNIERTVADLKGLQASPKNCLQRFWDIPKKQSILFILDKVINCDQIRKNLCATINLYCFKKQVEYFY